MWVSKKEWTLLNRRIDHFEEILAKVEMDANIFVPQDGKGYAATSGAPRILGISKVCTFSSVKEIILLLLHVNKCRLYRASSGEVRIEQRNGL